MLQGLFQKASMDLKQSISNQTKVSTKLATNLLSKKFPKSNVVFFPLSIHAFLSVVAASAKDRTLGQLLSFLKANTSGDLNSLYSQLLPLILSDGGPNDEPRLSVANGVWVEKTLKLKPSFKQLLDIDYKAACKQVDFRNKAVEVSYEVNLWAEKKTNGLIKEVLPVNSVNSLTRLIFANALYFKGAWHYPFDEISMRELDFHLLDGNKVKVPFMSISFDQFIQEYDDFKVLGLYYLKSLDKQKFIMYFFLPHAKDGIQALVDKISSTPNFLDNHIPCQNVKVWMSFGFEAADILKESGLVLPVHDSADELTEMVDLPRGETLYVSRIYHRSFVEVNEEGTEAAAVTDDDPLLGCAPPGEEVHFIDFVADHPFLFVIREDLIGVLLFIRQVIDPLD